MIWPIGNFDFSHAIYLDQFIHNIFELDNLIHDNAENINFMIDVDDVQYYYESVMNI